MKKQRSLHLNQQTQMDRPQKIRILGKDINIIYSTEAAGMCSLGLSQYDLDLINIREGQPSIGERNTALHECIHMVEYGMGLDLTEKQVTVLANGLMAVFEDNPEFAKYIIGLK